MYAGSSFQNKALMGTGMRILRFAVKYVVGVISLRVVWLDCVRV
jgi:hypothetical protein